MRVDSARAERRRASRPARGRRPRALRAQRRELIVRGRDDDDVGLERRAARRASRTPSRRSSAASAAARVRADVVAPTSSSSPERTRRACGRSARSRRCRRAAAHRLMRTRSRSRPANSKSNGSSVAPAAAIAWRVSLGSRRVDEQEAAAAGADELAADRAAAARERVERVDALVGHARRALALVLPVLVHQLGVATRGRRTQQRRGCGGPSPWCGGGSRASPSSPVVGALVLVGQDRGRAARASPV